MQVCTYAYTMAVGTGGRGIWVVFQDKTPQSMVIAPRDWSFDKGYKGY